MYMYRVLVGFREGAKRVLFDFKVILSAVEKCHIDELLHLRARPCIKDECSRIFMERKETKEL